jgi:hypothetical protein
MLHIDRIKVGNIVTQVEYLPCKPCKHLAQEMEVSEGTARTITKLLKLWPYKTTVGHPLQPHAAVARLNFCNGYLLSVHDDQFES